MVPTSSLTAPGNLIRTALVILFESSRCDKEGAEKFGQVLLRVLLVRNSLHVSVGRQVIVQIKVDIVAPGCVCSIIIRIGSASLVGRSSISSGLINDGSCGAWIFDRLVHGSIRVGESSFKES